MPEFKAFPKIYRLNREVVITEKLDGTNAAIGITEDGEFYTQSRSRIITPDDDNFGFARWAYANQGILEDALGPGLHFGEWWGQGIQRGYGLDRKVFSLFNFERYGNTIPTHPQLSVVPLLWRGLFDQQTIKDIVENLRTNGSVAAPGFMKPEGIVIFHTQGKFGLKVTLEKDEQPKGQTNDN